MTLTELRHSGLLLTNANAKAIQNYVGSECPYGDFIQTYYFCDNRIDSEHFVQCGIIKNKNGFSVVTFNCSLVRPNYPIDVWQVDKVYSSSSDEVFAVHHFRSLVLKILSNVLKISTESALNV